MTINTPRPGLRERKLAATRRHIAAVAMALFRERGFDQVTIADIADAADVSKVTVFNHFHRKEDLFFDLLPEAHGLLETAVVGRAPDVTPFAAVQDLLLDLVRSRHPFAPAGNKEYNDFLRVAASSPVLIARAREAAAELEDHLARLFTEAGGPFAGAGGRSPGGAADPRLAAALVASAYGTIYRETARRQLAGEPTRRLLADHEARVRDAFERLDRALRPSPTG